MNLPIPARAAAVLFLALLHLLPATLRASDPELRGMLQALLDAPEAAESLRSRVPTNATVGLLPIQGDEDDYVRGLAQDLLVQAGLQPLVLPDADAAAARARLQADPASTLDALCLGELRGLTREVTGDDPLAARESTRLNAELQLRVESLADGAVIWSDTFSQESVTLREKSAGERATDLARDPPPWLWIGGGTLAALFLVGLFLRTMRRPR